MTDLLAAMEATWPAAGLHRVGPWLIREGKGGGQRVSAATAEASWHPDDIALAEAAQAGLGQPALFMLRAGDDALDAALDARGYDIVDPVSVYVAPVAALTVQPPARMTTFPIWPMLSIMRDLWAQGGIGPARIAVMARAAGPKAALLGRVSDRAAGVAFVACHEGMAMLHALHVAPELRGKGLGRNLLLASAAWAGDQGADRLALAVTRANRAANALYAGAGMTIAAQYHYRRAPSHPVGE